MPVKKPSDILYGVDEKPALWMTLFLGFQHVSIYAISLIFPVVIVREMGGTPAQAAFLVSMSMIAGGIGAIVQALPKGPIGSGYLCPQVCGPSFLTASIMAAKLGGLSLLFGMTFVAGLFEGLFSRALNRLRLLFPTEVTGLIVAMVGITVIRVASTNFLGLDSSDSVIEKSEVFVSFLTLAVMVGLNIWTRGNLKLFCVLIGMVVGYTASYILGDVQTAPISDSHLVWFPFTRHPGWSFSVYLIVPFIIAMLCSSLKSVGDLTTCQKINDAEWRRPDMKNISSGVLADSIGCMSAGLFGGMGQSTSSSNVGLSIATGVTSRTVSFAIGGLLIFLGFFPKLAAVFAIMPKAVMGSTLIFALGFMVVAGFQIMMSRMIDVRKTFVIGISLIFGLTVDLMPDIFAGIHSWISPIFSSSLSTATITAIVLNLIFRIGISQKAQLIVAPGPDSSEEIFSFMDSKGGIWGARKEVIYKAMSAINEFTEAAFEHELTQGDVEINASFDEYSLNVNIYYEGKLIDFPEERPDISELLTDEVAQLRFSEFLMGEYTDKIESSVENGRCHIYMHFAH